MGAATLLEAFSRLDDPRCRRGVRHPFAGMVVLMLLGTPARIREMEVLVLWAAVHWDQLKEPLGFDREKPPCATTISRTLAKCHVGDFEELLRAYPILRLITGDAIFAQRPLAELICSNGCDYLLQVEANQGDTLDALQHCFARAAERPPAAETTQKGGPFRKPVAYGSI